METLPGECSVKMISALRRTYMRLRFGKPVVIVSGLPRSGTSLIMQMLHAGGLEAVTDEIREADVDNPKGYYELEKVKELDKGGDKSWLAEHKGKVIKIISFLLRDLPLDLNYKVVFVLRDIDEIIVSQNKMLARRKEVGSTVSDEEMKKNYDMHLRKVRYLLKHTPNFETLYVNYRDIIENPSEQAEQLSKFFNGKLDINAMSTVVSKDLYRNRREVLATGSG